MPKNQAQLQVTIDDRLYDDFAQWKINQGFSNDSLALNYLLADFFGIEYPINKVEMSQRLESVEANLASLDQKVEALTQSLKQIISGSSNLDVENIIVSSAPTKKTKSKTVKTSVQKEEKSTPKSQPKKGTNQVLNYEEMTKKELFILLTERNIPHRIAPKDRLKRKEEMIADLLASEPK
jgi:regulator of replication initiation timing